MRTVGLNRIGISKFAVVAIIWSVIVIFPRESYALSGSWKATDTDNAVRSESPNKFVINVTLNTPGSTFEITKRTGGDVFDLNTTSGFNVKSSEPNKGTECKISGRIIPPKNLPLGVTEKPFPLPELTLWFVKLSNHTVFPTWTRGEIETPEVRFSINQHPANAPVTITAQVTYIFPTGEGKEPYRGEYITIVKDRKCILEGIGETKSKSISFGWKSAKDEDRTPKQYVVKYIYECKQLEFILPSKAGVHSKRGK